MSQSCIATIDVAALQHNFQKVKALAPNSRVLAMVKGNGYGHGLLTMVEHLPQADAYGLARFSEAMLLRQHNCQKRIVMTEGFINSDELSLIDELALDLVLHDIEQVRQIVTYSFQQPIRIWLKIETGMHRLGLFPEHLPEAWKLLSASPHISNEIILMTHFAQSEQLDNEKTLQQIQDFKSYTDDYPAEKSLANSAAIMAWPDSHADWVRPGIMLYGVSPFPQATQIAQDLLPVMTLRAKLIAIRHLPAGAEVGYNSIWTCPEAMPVGVAAVGYADGYPRYIPSQGTPVLVNGQQAQIIGRISMDMISIDLRSIANVKLGADVTLWGKDLPVETIAKFAKTSPYELISGITSRVERFYI